SNIVRQPPRGKPPLALATFAPRGLFRTTMRPRDEEYGMPVTSAIEPPILRCTDDPAHTLPLRAAFYGCPTRSVTGHSAPIEVRYDYAALATILDDAFWQTPGASMWHYRPLLPVQDEASIVSLGTGNTPLLPSLRLGPALGLRRLFYKNDAGS